MRMVVDLADRDRSTWVVISGTSGHPTSRHFADQVAAWRDGEWFAWPVTRASVDAAARDTLTLAPPR